VSEALARLLSDPELRERLGRAGIETARDYTWELRIDALEGFLEEVATPRRIKLNGVNVPEVRLSAAPEASGAPASDRS
jgi:hypothetical protein